MVQQQLAKVSVGGLLHATFVVHPLSLAYLSSTDWPFANRFAFLTSDYIFRHNAFETSEKCVSQVKHRNSCCFGGWSLYCRRN
ncbi:hypothetical protein I312_102638 [Cryptococcus bacillisporus CA1280]|uniref:uncharacterized protein n=1 Tax=Cryptococcus bacillisporus CA1280 TaxID=1296109 RepID=UPI0033670277